MSGIGNYTDSLTAALRRTVGREGIVEELPASSIGSGMRPLHRVMYLWRLRRFLQGGAAAESVIHFTNIYVPPKVPGVKYVVTIHDLDPLMLPGMHSVQYAAYFAYIIKRSIQRADLILTDTVSVKEELTERFGVPEQRVRDVGVGLSEEFTQSADRAVARPPDRPTLLFVGQLNMKKNVLWLVNTFMAGVASKRIPPVRLVLAGSAGHGIGPIREVLQHADTDMIEWIVRPPLDRLTELYRSCSAVIVPSIREGFGIPLLEAMYCERPIIASDIPTNREVAGAAAEFFALNDPESFYSAVNAVLKDNNAGSRLSAAAVQLKRYQWDTLAARCLSFYDELSKDLPG